MKKSIVFVLFALIHTFIKANDKEIVKSTITEVTVYAQGAQLFQKATYSVKPGITEVIIEGISPKIDANSLQVKATGNVVLLDAKYSVFYPKPEDLNLEGLPLKIKKDILLLEDSLKQLGYEIQDIQDEIDVLMATKNILGNNGAVRGQGKVNDSINLLKQTVDYYATKMLEINKKMAVLNRRKSDKINKRTNMEDRLLKLKQHQSSSGFDPKDQGPIHRITVTLSAKEIATGKLSISYLVADAGWIPKYDLRSDGLTSKINLTYKAQVYQNSGLNWENVKLSISTNDPYQNKTKPTLHPWYIDYYAYRQEYKNIPMSTMKKEADQMGYSYEAPSVAEDMQSQTSAEFVQSIKQLTSAEFKIDLPYSIKSNNEQHIVLINVVDLDANYRYFCVPKLDNSVYLVAQLSKLDELNLVPASANIFFDGSYIGETYIDPTTMEDTLSLSLGRDHSLLVKRTLLKKDSKEKIIGDKKERYFYYNIEIKNLKSAAVDIVIQDQLPITQNGDIIIEKIEINKAKIDEVTGALEWEMNVKPKESKLIQFSYKVKHNKDLQIPL